MSAGASGSVSIVFAADRSQIDQYLGELRAGIKIPVTFVPQGGSAGSVTGPASGGFSAAGSASSYRFVSAPIAPPSPPSSSINSSLLPSTAPGIGTGGSGGAGATANAGIAALSQAAAALSNAAAALNQSASAITTAAANSGGGTGAPGPAPTPGGALPGGRGGGRPTVAGLSLGRLARIGTVAYLPYQALNTIAQFEEAGTRSAIANRYGSALDRAVAGGYAQNLHDALAATPGVNILNTVLNEAYSPFGPSNRETKLAIRGAEEGAKDVLAQQDRYAATLASGDRVRQIQREATTGTISGAGARGLSALSDNFLKAREQRLTTIASYKAQLANNYLTPEERQRLLFESRNFERDSAVEIADLRRKSRSDAEVNIREQFYHLNDIRNEARQVGFQLDRNPFRAQLAGIDSSFGRAYRASSSSEEQLANKRLFEGQISLAAQQRNDQISQERLSIRAQTSSLNILLDNTRSPGTSDELARINDIYQSSRLKQRALRNAGDQTLVPDVIANTQAQLDVQRKQYIQSFKPENVGFFLDVSNQANFGAGQVLADIAKKRASVGSKDFSDLGPGADAGDANATKQAAEAIENIEGYAEDLPKILDELRQFIQKVNVN